MGRDQRRRRIWAWLALSFTDTFFLTRSQARDVVLWIAIKRRLSVKCVIGLNIDIMRRNHPKRYTNGCCTMNLQFTAQNYKTTGIPFPFTWEFLSEDLSARQNPAEKRELGDRKCVSMNNRIAPLNYELRARKCPIKCDWLSTISELELNREPGVIRASQKKVIIRSDRPWPLRTSYTTKSLSLKTCPSPIPVTKNGPGNDYCHSGTQSLPTHHRWLEKSFDVVVFCLRKFRHVSLQ